MKKRILPALLALAMVLTMLPMAVFADGADDIAIPGSESEAGPTTDGVADNKVTATGEGVYQSYTATAWLWWASDMVEKFDGVAKDATAGGTKTNNVADITGQWIGYEEAYKLSSEEAKAKLATLVQPVKEKFEAVKKLDFSKLGEGHTLTAATMGCLVPFTGLEELDLSGNQIGISKDSNDGIFLPDVKLDNVFKDLQILKLSDCGLKDVNILSTYTALTNLDVSNNADLDNIAFVAGESTGTGEGGKPTFANNATLTTLNITGTKVTSLAPLVYCTALTKLDAQGLELTDLGGLKEVAERAGKNANLTGASVKLTEEQNNPTTLANVKAILDKVTGTVTVKDHEGNEVRIPETGKITVTGEHGTVVLKVDGQEVAAGADIAVGKTVTVEMTPDSGYQMTGVAATCDGKPVGFVSGTNTFVMPAGDVALTVTFTQDPAVGIDCEYKEVTGQLLSAQLQITGLQADKYYVCQITKSVNGVGSSVAMKLDQGTTANINVLRLAEGNTYTVELWRCSTDSNNLADYGNRVFIKTLTLGE